MILSISYKFIIIESFTDKSQGREDRKLISFIMNDRFRNIDIYFRMLAESACSDIFRNKYMPVNRTLQIASEISFT